MLEVRLFGQVSLRLEDEPLPVRVPARALALLAYLLLHRDRPLARDAVAFAFWPDSPEDEARAKLRTHLHYLTRGLLPPEGGDPWILSDVRSIRWNPAMPVWVDVAEFEERSRDRSQAAGAVALYAGDLLAGFDDEWIEVPRARLRDTAVSALNTLAQEARAEGDRYGAIAAMQRLLAVDPYREDAVRMLIALRQELGDRAGAVKAYRDFAQRLKADLGVDPMPETVAAGEGLMANDVPAAPRAPARAKLPTGTVTFLFTDIQGSTQRWEQHRDAMPAALQHHDRILREAIEARDGAVFKTVGDGYCAAFAKALDAAAAAVDAQRALTAHDFTDVEGLKVRMAMHTGAAHERDGDYFGPALNRTARILEIGHGGQVLLSSACEGQVRDGLSAGISLLDLGLHRLRDLAAPEHVYQLGILGLERAFSELRSLNVLSNNLNAQITPLVGRTEEIAAIEALVQDARFVTLTGAGGIGKTRVALQVAADLLDADGAWFVDFAAIDEPGLVENAVAEVLGLRDAGAAASLLDAAANLLKHKRAMLVFDNCEHVVAAAAKAAERLLSSCPQLRIVATSREPLGVGGEHVFRMPTLTESFAVELFASRARAAQHEFVLDDANTSAVTSIVRRLDGIPLAIELAAARVRTLGIEELNRRLDERFKLLTGGSRTALPRQQTLRGLIAWSYDLLEDGERGVFRRLSVFAGGFTLDLAVELCAGDALEDFEVVDLLTRLVDKSLIHAESIERDVRYRLLESTRAFARERLNDSQELTVACGAHARALLNLAKRLETQWIASGRSEDENAARRELENWRAALRWTLKEGNDRTTGARLAAAMRFAWSRFGPAEGRAWIRLALGAIGELEPADAAELYLADAHLSMLLNEYPSALASARAALERFEPGDAGEIAEARLYAGVSLGFLGSTQESEDHLQAALVAFRTLGFAHRIASALQGLAVCRVTRGDLESARALFSEALQAYQRAGAEASAAHMALNLAEVEFQSGNAERALELVLQAETSDRARGDENALVYDLCNRSAYLLALDRAREAELVAREALDRAVDSGAVIAVCLALQRIAAIAAIHPGNAPDGERPRLAAARMLGFVSAQFERFGYGREYTEQREYDRALEALASGLEDGALAIALHEGGLWDDGRARTEAASLTSNAAATLR